MKARLQRFFSFSADSRILFSSSFPLKVHHTLMISIYNHDARIKEPKPPHTLVFNLAVKEAALLMAALYLFPFLSDVIGDFLIRNTSPPSLPLSNGECFLSFKSLLLPLLPPSWTRRTYFHAAPSLRSLPPLLPPSARFLIFSFRANCSSPLFTEQRRNASA